MVDTARGYGHCTLIRRAIKRPPRRHLWTTVLNVGFRKAFRPMELPLLLNNDGEEISGRKRSPRSSNTVCLRLQSRSNAVVCAGSSRKSSLNHREVHDYRPVTASAEFEDLSCSGMSRVPTKFSEPLRRRAQEASLSGGEAGDAKTPSARCLSVKRNNTPDHRARRQTYPSSPLAAHPDSHAGQAHRSQRLG
jgi:hypothetical protein